MTKIYEYKNATVYVLNADTYDREGLKKATKEFLRNMVKGEKESGNSHTTRNI